MNDPIVEEVRHARAEIAARHGHDLHRIADDGRRRQGADQHPVVSYEPKDSGGTECVVREEQPPRR